MNPLVGQWVAPLLAGFSSWMRDRHGSAGVEFAIGSVLILTTTVAGLDLYQVINAQSVALRAATTVAEYTSLEQAPRAAFLDDLAAFSHRHEVVLPSRAVFVVSAVGRSEATDLEPDPPPVVHWSRKITVGKDSEPAPLELADSCGRLGDSSDGAAALSTILDMEPGEQVIVVEVCVKLLPEALVSGRLLKGAVLPDLFYQHQIFPVRGENAPDEPS